MSTKKILKPIGVIYAMCFVITQEIDKSK